MSQGNPVVKLRVSKLELHHITEAIARRNKLPDAGVMTVTDWLREAIWEKIKHARRAKKSRSLRNYRNQPSGAGVVGEVE